MERKRTIIEQKRQGRGGGGDDEVERMRKQPSVAGCPTEISPATSKRKESLVTTPLE